MAPKSDFGQSGAIVRAHLRNFMTYNDTTLKPGTNLNMVVGPNGSGKSAIVCAIIVGLAGDVTLTGRATSITDLVQRGCKWGSTEIELFNDQGRNWVVERKIILLGRSDGKQDFKNEWRLNGNLVPKRDIQELMTKLNIKVDNLCQFLPQDSVANFVKMNSGELLVETLNAAGCHQLVQDLEKLVALTQEIASKTRQLDFLKKSSAEHEVNARRLETEVEELRQREAMMKKKALCSLKIHYMRYQEILTRCDQAKDGLTDKEEGLRQAKSEGDPYLKKIQHFKSEEVRLQDMVRAGYTDSKKVEELVNHYKESIERKKMECQNKYKNFKDLQEAEQQRDQQIRMTQQELESYECRLTEIREVDYSKELDTIKSLIAQIRNDMMRNKRDKDALTIELQKVIRKDHEVSSDRTELLRIKDRRLESLSRKKKDAGIVCNWLAKNRDKFEKHVFLPMMCEIDVKSIRDAPIIEQVMNEADFYSFMCQTDSDLMTLTSFARRERARINVSTPPEKTIGEYEQQLQQHMSDSGSLDHSTVPGFRCYLKDLIEAPEPIMRYLYGQYQFHRIPVFSDLSESNLKRVMESGCSRFYVRNKCFQTSRSRYDGRTNTLSSTLNSNARILEITLDRKRLEQLNGQLQKLKLDREEFEKQMSRLNEECSESQNAFREHTKRQDELSTKQGERKRIETFIDLKRKKIAELKSTIINMEAAEAQFHEAIKTINKKMVDDLERLGKAIASFAEIRETLCLNVLKSKLSRRFYRMAERAYNEVMERTRTLEVEIREEKKKVQALVAALEAAKNNAEEKIKGFRNERLDKATKSKFATIEQDTVEELELLEEELKARIQGMSRGGNAALEEFNRQTRELSDKRRQISELEEDLKKDNVEMQSLREKFLPELNDVIKVIDEHYRDFMRKLNYDGRVTLGRDVNNVDDFSKYGIDIMVKYRDEEELIPLSGTRQSGGERSVATMIYMLALQTKTTVPFRVVDEINQGMDKDNERKVFELLVRVADESSSQYFLVSPKLLSGLNYGERMQIHIVFNGPQLKYCFDDLKKSGSPGASVCGDEAYESDNSAEVYYDTQ